MNSVSKKYRYQGFEKADVKSAIVYIYYPYKYRNVSYCNNGLITARYPDENGVKRVCKGHIKYMTQRDAIDYKYVEEHYWYWGDYGGTYDEKDYCR